VSVNREELKRIIDHIPEQDAIKVADFIGYLNARREREALNNLEQVSVTSMEFWDNPIDDEVWNNV
jgi:aspartate carbamoyltransferase regulatory subunit